MFCGTITNVALSLAMKLFLLFLIQLSDAAITAASVKKKALVIAKQNVKVFIIFIIILKFLDF